MIELLRAGALASVQDNGRPGFRRFGVGTAGALDPLALAIGNRLLGNHPGDAAIEFTLGRASMRFHADMRIALAGAECRATLDGEPVWSWHAIPVRRGQTLVLPAAQGASRTYLCVAGGIDVAPVMGSRSTDLKAGFGGHEGRALRDGDRLPVGQAIPAHAAEESAQGTGASREPSVGVAAPAWALALAPLGKAMPIRMLPGIEYPHFSEASRQALWETDWTLTPNSNRMGFRLQGVALAREPAHAVDLLSHGVMPGVMQVPPGGQPIVLMADAQTTGGYPKIGVVIGADLWRLAQAPLGATVRFVQVSLEQAAQAQADVDRYLRQIDQALQWQRNGMDIAARRRARTRVAG